MTVPTAPPAAVTPALRPAAPAPGRVSRPSPAAIASWQRLLCAARAQQTLSAGSRRRAGCNQTGVSARPPRPRRDEPNRAELGLRRPRPGNAGAHTPRAAVPRASGRYCRRSALVHGSDPLRGGEALTSRQFVNPSTRTWLARMKASEKVAAEWGALPTSRRSRLLQLVSRRFFVTPAGTVARRCGDQPGQF